MTDQSIFDAAANGTTTQDAATEQQQPLGVADLIGEGKKYKTQEEALAALPHAQAHIARLEAENKRLAEQAAKLDVLLAKLDSTNQSSQHQQEERQRQSAESVTAATQQNENETVTPDKVAEIVSQLREREKAEENYKRAEEALKNRYGDKLPEVLNKFSQELGMSLKEMQAVAERSPSAFLNMLGLNDTSNTGNANQAAQPTVPGNTAQDSNATVRNFAYYEKLRKQDPGTYWKESVQVQLHKDAEALGDAFFRN